MIRKVLDDFPVEGDVGKHGESISELSESPCWKAKAERRRGAPYSWLTGECPERAGHFKPGSVTHVVHRVRLTQSTIDGDVVLSVCGSWFVFPQDHQGLPLCVERDCVRRMRNLQFNAG